MVSLELRSAFLALEKWWPYEWQRTKGVLGTIGGVSAVLLVVSVFYIAHVIEPKERHAKEHCVWKEESDNGIAGLYSYLEEYPDGEFAETAHRRIVAEEVRNWEVESASGTTGLASGLRTYLERYPDGELADSVRERVVKEGLRCEIKVEQDLGDVDRQLPIRGELVRRLLDLDVQDVSIHVQVRGEPLSEIYGAWGRPGRELYLGAVIEGVVTIRHIPTNRDLKREPFEFKQECPDDVYVKNTIFDDAATEPEDAPFPWQCIVDLTVDMLTAGMPEDKE